MPASSENLLKIVLIGPAGVGKTHMLQYFTRPSDTHEGPPTKPTIGVEFGTKIVRTPDGRELTAQIWDTAGQERYRAITKAHYKRADAAFIVYDVSDRKSFEDAKAVWYPELVSACMKDQGRVPPIMLVGNKIDLESQVTVEEHEAFAKEKNLLPMRTSAMTGENIDEAFNDITIRTHKSRIVRDKDDSLDLNKKQKSGGCC